MLFAWLWATKSVLHRLVGSIMVSSLAHPFTLLIATAVGVYQPADAASKIASKIGPGLENLLIAINKSMPEAESWRRQQEGKAEKGEEGRAVW